jgi:hypothetical protein
VIVDDCPEAHYIIPKLRDAGFDIKLFSFRNEKISKYIMFRAKLRQKKIKMYPHTQFVTQLKGLQIEEDIKFTKIYKGSGNRDDFPDSAIMGLYYFLNDDEGFSSEVDYVPTIPNLSKNVRTDTQWKSFTGGSLEEIKVWSGIR